MLKSYLFLVHLLLDRKFSMLYFLPWQKMNQILQTVKLKQIKKMQVIVTQIIIFYLAVTYATSFVHGTASSFDGVCCSYSNVMRSHKTADCWNIALNYLSSHSPRWLSSGICMSYIHGFYQWCRETRWYSITLTDLQGSKQTVMKRLRSTQGKLAWSDMCCYSNSTPKGKIQW